MTPIESLPAKLLPCPFCGSASIDAKGWASGNSAGPACDDCGASAGCVSSDLADNIAAWNRRAAQPKEGELLALADRIEHHHWDVGDKEKAIAFAHELRTLASRRVTVDDEMVERACVGMSLGIEADGEWPKDYPDDEQAIIRNGMRAALTAALQPDSGEG